MITRKWLNKFKKEIRMGSMNRRRKSDARWNNYLKNLDRRM
tara:strand:+ start:423 stop:545 length:123 start_codon:yes stop_codon:yes gene_type:complete